MGDDLINNIIVKASKKEVVKVLTYLINRSFDEGAFPNSLKKAKVIPLHKEGPKTDENNYRPISLLTVWSKIFERVMYNRMYNFLEHFSLLYSKQFGFRAKHSTIDALVELTEKLRYSKYQKKMTFFLDLKKAFDTLDHNVLLDKIEKYGIRGNCLKWLHSYLTNRMQRVEANGTTSKWKEIKYGVPQGSILGPLLFLIYINDLPLACKSLDVILFADDTNLTALNCDIEDIEEDLHSLNNWLNANRLALNRKKSVQMNIGKTASITEFCLSDCVIDAKTVCKYLGILVDNKLSFQSHIDFVKQRLGKQCGIISKLRHYVPRSQLLAYYSSNIKPIIQYGILVYGCCSYSSLEPIFILQKKILKFIYFRKRRDTCSDIFNDNKILTVFELYIYELLKFVLRSVIRAHTQDFLNNMFEVTNCRNTRYSNNQSLQEPVRKRQIERQSIKFRATKLYNLLNRNGALPPNISAMNLNAITNLYHKLKYLYIHQNHEIVKHIFGQQPC